MQSSSAVRPARAARAARAAQAVSAASAVRPLFAALSLASLVACGDSEEPVSPTREGRFLDSAVAGLAWATDSGAGLTGADGEFTYEAGESVVFSIGDVALPEIPAAPLITPVEVFAELEDPARATAVANLARLLQTLDVDGDPGNGIVLGPDAALSATGLALDFTADDFDTRAANLVANGGSGAAGLVTAETATAHLDATRAAEGLGMSGCGSEHPFVGRTAAFDTFSHGVAGTLEVIDDCTLEVRGFDYDGQGPSVFFYASRSRDYGSADAFALGPRLNGTLWRDDTIRLTLPEGRSLDTVDSLSVWCFDFLINFGDAFFGEPGDDPRS